MNLKTVNKMRDWLSGLQKSRPDHQAQASEISNEETGTKQKHPGRDRHPKKKTEKGAVFIFMFSQIMSTPPPSFQSVFKWT